MIDISQDIVENEDPADSLRVAEDTIDRLKGQFTEEELNILYGNN